MTLNRFPVAYELPGMPGLAGVSTALGSRYIGSDCGVGLIMDQRTVVSPPIPATGLHGRKLCTSGPYLVVPWPVSSHVSRIGALKNGITWILPVLHRGMALPCCLWLSECRAKYFRCGGGVWRTTPLPRARNLAEWWYWGSLWSNLIVLRRWQTDGMPSGDDCATGEMFASDQKIRRIQ
jgi:hypothetical protein